MLISDTALADTYYRALLDRSPDYAGIFFVGVKTTGVFCISTCRARKPKRENVEFYTDMRSALGAGFRPCKVCRPTEDAHAAPAAVKQVKEWLRRDPTQRITDAELKRRGIAPEPVRRWFTRNYGMTFQAFQRSLRLNSALDELKGGATVTGAAFDSGYESLSGFGYACKKLTGESPSGASRVILMHRFTTPIGPMMVCATEQGVCLLEFTNRRILEREFADLQRLLKARIIAGENDHTRQAEREIGEYLTGKRRNFAVALHMPGTEFQCLAWQCLQTVPYAQTASYQEQAGKLGRPKAVRAVAAANGANRISIIVPCHRIIGKDGSLVGYGGGVARKQWLLEHERRHAVPEGQDGRM